MTIFLIQQHLLSYTKEGDNVQNLIKYSQTVNNERNTSTLQELCKTAMNYESRNDFEYLSTVAIILRNMEHPSLKKVIHDLEIHGYVFFCDPELFTFSKNDDYRETCHSNYVNSKYPSFFEDHYNEFIRTPGQECDQLGCLTSPLECFASFMMLGREEDADDCVKRIEKHRNDVTGVYPGGAGSGWVTYDLMQYILTGKLPNDEFTKSYYDLFPLLKEKRDYFINLIDKAKQLVNEIKCNKNQEKREQK